MPAIILLLLSFSANAEIVELFQTAHHPTAPRDKYEINEITPGVGIEYDGYAFGTFLNSMDRQSYYFGRAWRTNYNILTMEIKGGIVTGYRYPLMVVPSIGIGYNGYALKLSLIPSKYYALALSTEVKF